MGEQNLFICVDFIAKQKFVIVMWTLQSSMARVILFLTHETVTN